MLQLGCWPTPLSNLPALIAHRTHAISHGLTERLRQGHNLSRHICGLTDAPHQDALMIVVMFMSIYPHHAASCQPCGLTDPKPPVVVIYSKARPRGSYSVTLDKGLTDFEPPMVSKVLASKPRHQKTTTCHKTQNTTAHRHQTMTAGSRQVPQPTLHTVIRECW